MSINVCCTAVGGGVGLSIVKALSDTKYKTIGIDPSPYAAGLYMADTGCLGRNIDEKDFLNTIIQICHKEKCKFLFPGLDAELKVLADNFIKLKDQGITPIVSDPAVIELSDDKMKLMQFLKDEGLPYIKTAKSIQEAEEIGIEPPVVVKPMIGGCRSKDVYFCQDFKEVDNRIAGREEEFIIQENIDGEEYTCGSVTFNKMIQGTIIMQRELRAGDTYRAYVKKDDNIDHFLERIISVINPFGPCNIQLRVRDNIPYVFEINARCSGTTASRALVGFNEPEICCDYMLGKEPKRQNIQEKAILRYWNECVVDYSDIEGVKNEGRTNRRKGRIRNKI